jgi:1-phosphofructokinase family hexose kinase
VKPGILCITPNADLERTWTVPGFRRRGVFRVEGVTLLPSGKGINVARAIRTLGGWATCAGFLGGHTGRLIHDLLEAAGLPGKWTWVDGESRVAVAIVDPRQPGHDATLLSEPGPPVTPAGWERLSADVLTAAAGAQLACLSGSLPTGSPPEALEGLLVALREQGVPAWVDTSGAALPAALRARPSGIKINRMEVQELLGLPVRDLEEARQAAVQLLATGIPVVCITLGAGGALVVNEAGCWAARPPRLTVISTVGSGDAFLGGLLHGLAGGQPIPEALRMATAAGAANTLKLGGGAFDLADYQALLPRVRLKAVVSGQ